MLLFLNLYWININIIFFFLLQEIKKQSRHESSNRLHETVVKPTEKMSVKFIYRRLTPRAFALSAILLTVILCVYYSSLTTQDNPSSLAVGGNNDGVIGGAASLINNNSGLINNLKRFNASVERSVRTAANRNTLITQDTLIETCPKLDTSDADIDTYEVFRDFDFQVSH